MTGKPVRPRVTATADFDQITDFYVDEAGAGVAERFGLALTEAYAVLEAHPAAGSPAPEKLYRRPGLRTWPVKGFPYLICYFDTPDHVDVWRILHGARDLGSLLDGEPEAEG